MLVSDMRRDGCSCVGFHKLVSRIQERGQIEHKSMPIFKTEFIKSRGCLLSFDTLPPNRRLAST